MMRTIGIITIHTRVIIGIVRIGLSTIPANATTAQTTKCVDHLKYNWQAVEYTMHVHVPGNWMRVHLNMNSSLYC